MGSIPLHIAWILCSLHIANALFTDCLPTNKKCLTDTGLQISPCRTFTPSVFINFLSGPYVCKVAYWTTNVTVSLKTQKSGTVTIQKKDGATYKDVVTKAAPYNHLILTKIGSTVLRVKVNTGVIYDVRINRPENGNNYASHLNITHCTLVPKFNKKIRNYNCTVETTISDVEISYTVEDKWAQQNYKQGGKELGFFTVVNGRVVPKANKARVVIFAENDAKGVYRIDIYRKADASVKLDMMSVPQCRWKPLMPKYNVSKPVYYYECSVYNNASNLYIKLHLNSSRAQVDFANTNRNLRVGSNDVFMKINAHDRITTASYHFYIIRAVSVNSTNNSEAYELNLNNCKMDRKFRSYIYSYSCGNNFSNPTRILTKSNFMVKTNDKNATWSIEGANPIKPFWNTINLTIVSEDKSNTTKYRFRVFREPNNDTSLKNLSFFTQGLNGRIMHPDYSGCKPPITLKPGKSNYTCVVDYLARMATMTIVSSDPDTTLDPNVINVTLKTKSNQVNFTIRASNRKDFQTYHVNIFRTKPENNSMLSKLSIPGCNLVPAFSKNITDYTCVTTITADSIAANFERDSVRSTHIIAYPRTLGPNATHAFFGLNYVRITVTSESLDKTIYQVTIIRTFLSKINQPIATFTNMSVASTEWDAYGGIKNDVMNSSHMIALLDRVLLALDGSALSPDVPKNRLAVVGLRPGVGNNRVIVDIGIIPYSKWKLLKLRPASDKSDSWVAAHFSSAFVQYKNGIRTKFNGPSVGLLNPFQDYIKFYKVPLIKLVWPVKYRVSQVLGPTKTGIPSSISTLSKLSFPGCGISFNPAKTYYTCLTSNAVRNPGGLTYELNDTVYSTSTLTSTAVPFFHFGFNTISIKVMAENKSTTTYILDLTRSFSTSPNMSEVKSYKNLEVWASNWAISQPPLNAIKNINTDNVASMHEVVDSFLKYCSKTGGVLRNRLAVVSLRQISSSLLIHVAVMDWIKSPVESNKPAAIIAKQYTDFLKSIKKNYTHSRVTMLLFDTKIPRHFRVSQVLGDTPGGKPTSDSTLTALNVSGCQFSFKSDNLLYRCMMESKYKSITVSLTLGTPAYSQVSISDTTMQGTAYIKKSVGENIEFSKNSPLEWGYNEISIKVVGEDGTTGIYKVLITRTLESDFNNMCIDKPEGWHSSSNPKETCDHFQKQAGGTNFCKTHGNQAGTGGVKVKVACCFCGGGQKLPFVDRQKLYTLQVFKTVWADSVIANITDVDKVKKFSADLITSLENYYNPSVPRNRLAVIGLHPKAGSKIVVDVAVMPCVQTGCPQKFPIGSNMSIADIVKNFDHKRTTSHSSQDPLLKKMLGSSTVSMTLLLFKQTWRVSQALGKTPNDYPYTSASLEKLKVEHCQFRLMKDYMKSVTAFSYLERNYYCLVAKSVSKSEMTYKLLGPKDYFKVTSSIPTKLKLDDTQDFYFGKNEIRVVVEGETGDKQTYSIFVTRSLETTVTQTGNFTVSTRIGMEYIPTYWSWPDNINDAAAVVKLIKNVTGTLDEIFSNSFKGDKGRLEIVGVRRASNNNVILDLSATQGAGAGRYSTNQILRIVQNDIKAIGAKSDKGFLKYMTNYNVVRKTDTFLGVDITATGLRTALLGGMKRIIIIHAPTMSTAKETGTSPEKKTGGTIILIVIIIVLVLLCLCLLGICYNNKTTVKGIFHEASPTNSPKQQFSSPTAPGIDLDQI